MHVFMDVPQQEAGQVHCLKMQSACILHVAAEGTHDLSQRGQ